MPSSSPVDKPVRDGRVIKALGSLFEGSGFES